MDTFIGLRHGGEGAGFDADDLLSHMRSRGISYMIQAQQNCTLAEHTKPSSLDVWLRINYADNPDTKQATNEVIASLVRTGLFREGRFRCPDLGTFVKGIEIVQ